MCETELFKGKLETPQKKGAAEKGETATPGGHKKPESIKGKKE